VQPPLGPLTPSFPSPAATTSLARLPIFAAASGGRRHPPHRGTVQPPAVKTATYRVAVGVKTAGIRW
jgi:hypothetical protein